MPDFAWAGEGVRLSDVVADSPAEVAGLAAGDVVVELNGEPVTDLKGYSRLLKALAPGDRVLIGYLRGAERREAEAVLTTR